MFSSLQFELFLKLLPKYLNKCDKVLEIGSGPGRNLAIINKIIGCDVYGIEKSKSRYKVNQEIFKANDIDKLNVILGDFQHLKKTKAFDSVISQGFIEHYHNPQQIILRQSKFLKKEGIFICSIPNFSGLNRKIQNVLNCKILSAHNLEIMNIDNFSNLFDSFEPLYCGYLGIYSGRIFSTNKPFLKTLFNFLKPLRIICNILIILFSSIFSTSKIKTGPYLLFIGRKK